MRATLVAGEPSPVGHMHFRQLLAKCSNHRELVGRRARDILAVSPPTVLKLVTPSTDDM
jgi:hypothetical protein